MQLFSKSRCIAIKSETLGKCLNLYSELHIVCVFEKERRDLQFKSALFRFLTTDEVLPVSQVARAPYGHLHNEIRGCLFLGALAPGCLFG